MDAHMNTLPSIENDFPAWYADVVRRAGLAENAAVRGMMVIKPYGYAIWELLQRQMDDRIKATGHENFYFPMLIPASVLAKEADLVEGFAPEVAVVTEAGGSKLEEPLVLRPTSEAVIWNTYGRWLQSYRDSPHALQPVGERGALGAAATPVPAHQRVPVAGGAHRPRD
jgi:prolyl-tRNA synthetase